MSINLNQVLEDVKAAALEAGAFIRQEASGFDMDKVELKGKNDLVSYVDKETEKKLVKSLKQIVPQAGFITEEGTTAQEKAHYRWVVDPLDGTTNFIHGLPVFSVSIGLMQDAEVVLGLVYEVNRDECFYATSGEGAFCNGKAIHVTPAESIDEALLATGFPYHNFEKLDQYLAILNQLMKHCHGLRRMGSAAVDLAYVACGRYEGYFEYNLNPWDVAAGTLIVEEAGGIVTDFKGGRDFVFGRELVAANAIQPQLLDIIKRYW